MSDNPPPTERRSRPWRFLIGLIISLLLLFLAFRQTEPDQLWAIFLAADRRLLFAAFFLHLIGLMLRAGRWRLLFWREQRLRYADFLDAVNIGYLVNNLFPVRLGDIIRSLLLGRWLEIGSPRAFSATVIERVLDSALILILFFSLLLVLPLPPFALNVGLLMGAAVLFALILMLVALWQQDLAGRWLFAALKVFPFMDAQRWTDRLMGLIKGFGALRQAGTLVPFFGWSLVVWTQTILAFWLTMRAFDPEVGLELAALATTAAALGLAAPSAPAGLGTFEAAVIGALFFTGMEENLARSMAIGLHLTTFLATTFAGFFSLTRRGIGYRHLVEMTEQQDPNMRSIGTPPAK